VLADLVVDLLIAQVHLHAQAGGAQPLGRPLRIPVRVRGDCGDHHLNGSQPKRKSAGVVLDQYAEEALETAQDGPVQHEGRALGPVVGHILGAESFGQVGIQLQGAQLPNAPDGVLDAEVQLGPVERALPRIDVQGDPGGLRGARQRGLGHVPGFVRPGLLVGRVENFTA
jgi:hypothetical protein